MKICRVVFSTNRLEFLKPTLESHDKMIDFGSNQVHSILIDDYPNGRDNQVMLDLAKKHNFNQLVLHSENKGITLTWSELWDHLATQDYDYIWHHEDDVVFHKPVSIDLLIEFLQTNKDYCQVNLKRNPWYDFEYDKPIVTDQDGFFHQYRVDTRNDYFWSMASLYPSWITKEPIKQHEKCNLGEYPIMKYLREKYNMKMGILKGIDGSHLVEHIGIYSQGKRVLEGEPGWDRFKFYDPDKKYDSKTGTQF